jgi:hypothetical protein
MRDGICPKCGAAEVRGARAHFNWGGEEGVRVRTGAIVRGSQVDTYMCTACGFYEHYLADPGKLAEVAEKWARIEPPTET